MNVDELTPALIRDAFHVFMATFGDFKDLIERCRACLSEIEDDDHPWFTMMIFQQARCVIRGVPSWDFEESIEESIENGEVTPEMCEQMYRIFTEFFLWGFTARGLADDKKQLERMNR
jgi:hypothetical protein